MERMDEIMPYGQYGLVTFIRKGAVRSLSLIHISCAYTFFIGYVIILVTIIREIAKVRLLGRRKRLSFTNFSIIDVLFKRSPRKEKAKKEFKLHSECQPAGDQPQDIEALVKGFRERCV